MYAREMSVRDIQATLLEMYNVEVSEGVIADKVYEDVKVSNSSVYPVLAINMEGKKELLGMWIAPNEGAKFWLSVMTGLKNLGVKDLFIA